MSPKPTGKNGVSVEPQMSDIIRRRRDGPADTMPIALGSKCLRLVRALRRRGWRMTQLWRLMGVLQKCGWRLMGAAEVWLAADGRAAEKRLAADMRAAEGQLADQMAADAEEQAAGDVAADVPAGTGDEKGITGLDTGIGS